MYLDIGVKCSGKSLFRVPHKKNPVSALWIEKHFPAFAAEFTGMGMDSILKYFYKKDPSTNIFEFIDEESKDEVADMMGVSTNVHEMAVSESVQSRQLSSEEVATFREFIQDVHALQQEYAQKEDTK